MDRVSQANSQLIAEGASVFVRLHALVQECPDGLTEDNVLEMSAMYRAVILQHNQRLQDIDSASESWEYVLYAWEFLEHLFMNPNVNVLSVLPIFHRALSEVFSGASQVQRTLAALISRNDEEAAGLLQGFARDDPASPLTHLATDLMNGSTHRPILPLQSDGVPELFSDVGEGKEMRRRLLLTAEDELIASPLKLYTLALVLLSGIYSQKHLPEPLGALDPGARWLLRAASAISAFGDPAVYAPAAPSRPFPDSIGEGEGDGVPGLLASRFSEAFNTTDLGEALSSLLAPPCPLWAQIHLLDLVYCAGSPIEEIYGGAMEHFITMLAQVERVEILALYARWSGVAVSNVAELAAARPFDLPALIATEAIAGLAILADGSAPAEALIRAFLDAPSANFGLRSDTTRNWSVHEILCCLRACHEAADFSFANPIMVAPPDAPPARADLERVAAQLTPDDVEQLASAAFWLSQTPQLFAAQWLLRQAALLRCDVPADVARTVAVPALAAQARALSDPFPPQPFPVAPRLRALAARPEPACTAAEAEERVRRLAQHIAAGGSGLDEKDVVAAAFALTRSIASFLVA